jgi:disulfide oxidoreductase YuzD
MIRSEVEHRFGDSASIVYHDASRAEVLASHGVMIQRIQDQGLVYPVTVVDGEPMYDGAVSYPAILRAVQARLSAS